MQQGRPDAPPIKTIFSLRENEAPSDEVRLGNREWFSQPWILTRWPDCNEYLLDYSCRKFRVVNLQDWSIPLLVAFPSVTPICTIPGNESANERRLAKGSDHEVFHCRNRLPVLDTKPALGTSPIVREQKLSKPFCH